MLACGLTPQPSASVISSAGQCRRSEVLGATAVPSPSSRARFLLHLLNTSDCWADISWRQRLPGPALAAAEPHAEVEVAAPDARFGEPALAVEAAAAPDARPEEPALAAKAAVEALALLPGVGGQPGAIPAWAVAGVVVAQASPGFSSASIPARPALHREARQERPSCDPSSQAAQCPASSVRPR